MLWQKKYKSAKKRNNFQLGRLGVQKLDVRVNTFVMLKGCQMYKQKSSVSHLPFRCRLREAVSSLHLETLCIAREHSLLATVCFYTMPKASITILLTAAGAIISGHCAKDLRRGKGGAMTSFSNIIQTIRAAYCHLLRYQIPEPAAQPPEATE